MGEERERERERGDASGQRGCIAIENVLLKYEDGSLVKGKGIRRKVVERMKQTQGSELAKKNLAYDGEKTLLALRPLPQKKNQFAVVLDDIPSGRNRRGSPSGSPGGDSPEGSDRKRLRKPYNTKTFTVELIFGKRMPMSAITQSMKGHEFENSQENSQEAVRVLDIILHQQSAAHYARVVHWFVSPSSTTTQTVSLTWEMVSWDVANRMLKNLRIRIHPSNQEYKIVGLSDLPYRDQTFMLKQRNGNGQSIEVTVSQYFKDKNTTLRGIVIIILVSMLANLGVPHFIRLSYATDIFTVLHQGRTHCRGPPSVSTTILISCYVNVVFSYRGGWSSFTAPKLKTGNGDFIPRDGRWNFNNKWAVVNFSAQCCEISQDLIKCGNMKKIDEPLKVFEERHNMQGAPPNVRVERMLEQVFNNLARGPLFLLRLLPKRKTSDLYGAGTSDFNHYSVLLKYEVDRDVDGKGIETLFEALADESTTMIVKPGLMVDFPLVNWSVNHPNQIDWQNVKYWWLRVLVLVIWFR
ncbi:Argonaute family protein [Rhynchospora pubera]|uniref:Argonaute family protein n=1 Tax=Rhynchospora pubera TaxID=906938 RepID=A0AAV8H3I6_9POAL|nr:Argonaute family protein [Rhynchospora pubera]